MENTPYSLGFIFNFFRKHFLYVTGFLDSKEFKPVSPRGKKSCMFIGRTDVEAETPIL